MTSLLWLLAPALSFAALIQGDPKTVFQDYTQVALARIEITNPSGNITVTPMTVDKAAITVVKKKFSENCKLTIERATVEVVTVKIESSYSEECEADISIQAPKTVALEITSGAGDVNISGMEGALKFALGAGNLTSNSSFKNIEGKSGAANIALANLTQSGSLEVGTGNVDLKFLENPHGSFSVNEGVGKTSLHFPKDSKINASLESALGTVHSDFISNPNGYNVTLKSGVGDLNIKSY
jgi:hypothetical protein